MAADERDAAMDEYFEHARHDLFPKMKESALSLTILGEPDPKLCMELGAAILFDKPILVIVPRGRIVPLALRTIATKIVELDGEHLHPCDQKKIQTAIADVMRDWEFRHGTGVRGKNK